MKTYLFDLDCTLVNTRGLWPYFSNLKGIDYVAKNASKLSHELYDRRIVSLVSNLHARKKTAVITNSPKHYASAILSSHGFPSDLPIFSSLNKPSIRNLKKCLEDNSINPEESLIIGDSPHDIIPARRLRACSAGVLWGRTDEARIKKSFPSAKARNYDELEEIIGRFENNNLERVYPLSDWIKYARFPENFESKDPDIKFSYLANYYSSSSKRMDEHSGKILDFKKSKEFYWDEIDKGMTADFFYNGNIITGRKFQDTINGFYNQLIQKSASLNLKSPLFIGAPNSLPPYFYPLDINQFIADNLNRHFKINADSERVITRVFATEATHLGADNNDIKTLGIRKTFSPSFDNIVVLDDIFKQGEHKKNIGMLLRYKGFTGNLHCITLGKNTH